MFYLNRETELDTALLFKMIQRFNTEVEPALQRSKNYYDGKQAIMQKAYSDASKPCSHTVTNYCKNIADSYCGYLATPSYISYRSEADIEAIMEVLRYNDYQTQDADYLLDALVHGVAAELCYIDDAGQVRFRLINPLQCFGIYDDSLTGDLLYFVRMYPINEWDDQDNWAVDVYSDYDVRHYSMNGMSGQLAFTGSDPHYFSQCPANIFHLPDEKAVFECIMGLQDAHNELLSSEIDDYSAFCDAYLLLAGMDAEDDDIKTMKENRVLLLPENGVAQWLTKSANDAQVENILQRIHESIYRVAQCPDFSSESFVGGVSSGIAIRYRLTGMETRAAKIAASMKKALQRRIEIICGVATLKTGEDAFTEVEITFKRNIPEDMATTAALVGQLQGMVSNATLLSLLPFVSDVNAELEALQEQKQANMAVYGAMFATTDDSAEEEAE